MAAAVETPKVVIGGKSFHLAGLVDETALDTQMANVFKVLTKLNSLGETQAGQIAALQSEIAALTARVQNLEANALTFKFENGAIVPVSQLQLKTRHFPGSAYYPTSAVLKIQLSEPSDADPY